MAAATALNVMTLGPQQKMSATLVQTSATGTNNGCVIVATGAQQILSPQNNVKTVVIQQKRMTPASPASSNTSSTNSDMLRCKRKINFSHGSHLTYPGHQPASVARRNARERNRVKQVNNGFATLRSHIPFAVSAAVTQQTSGSSNRGANKKLSKVETLRMAVEYIRSLQQLLDEHSAGGESIPTTTSSPPPETTTSTTANSDAGYYSSSPESTVTILGSQHLTSHPIIIQQSPVIASALSPPCSEASSSPTPSFASEGSGSAVSSYASTSVYAQDAYENYENYEPMSPEDEELLDVISWWQQAQ